VRTYIINFKKITITGWSLITIWGFYEVGSFFSRKIYLQTLRLLVFCSFVRHCSSDMFWQPKQATPWRSRPGQTAKRHNFCCCSCWLLLLLENNNLDLFYLKCIRCSAQMCTQRKQVDFIMENLELELNSFFLLTVIELGVVSHMISYYIFKSCYITLSELILVSTKSSVCNLMLKMFGKENKTSFHSKRRWNRVANWAFLKLVGSKQTYFCQYALISKNLI